MHTYCIYIFDFITRDKQTINTWYSSFHWVLKPVSSERVSSSSPSFLLLSRLLLWDCDERSYSYYIEVSNNQQQWTKVVDRTRQACR